MRLGSQPLTQARIRFGHLAFQLRRFDFDPIRTARNSRINIASNKTADHHNRSQQRHRASQAIKFPGSMQKDQVRPHQTGKNMKLKPFCHLPPTRRTRPLAQAIEAFSQNHQEKAQNSEGVAEQFTSSGNLPRRHCHKRVKPGHQQAGD